MGKPGFRLPVPSFDVPRSVFTHVTWSLCVAVLSGLIARPSLLLAMDFAPPASADRRDLELSGRFLQQTEDARRS
ncbi:MAG: hypothetical protein ACC628_07580, partial [Pirellulaceae bacterium]